MSAIDTNPDRALRCRAHDCPNNWAVSREGHPPLCSRHAWIDPREWPDMTQRILNDIAFAVEKRPAPVQHMTVAEKAATLKKLAATMRTVSGENKDHKAWAKRLHQRHLAGETLGQAQVAMYRSALNLTAADDELQRDLAA